MNKKFIDFKERSYLNSFQPGAKHFFAIGGYRWMGMPQATKTRKRPFFDVPPGSNSV
jgi:hypothetical protein